MSENMISSLQNPAVKEVVKLQQKHQERRKKKRFVVEGIREVSLALQTGVVPAHLFVCKDYFLENIEYPIQFEKYSEITKWVSPKLYEKIAYRSHAEGIILIAEAYEMDLNKLKLQKNPLIIALESVEKPGNLGAILRTADAANADAVIVCDPKTDIFNPNVIRSSLGCVFTRQIAVCTAEQLIDWTSEQSIKICIASVQSQENYFEKDLTQGIAFVFGTEAHGLSEIWYKYAHEQLRIPMQGRIDSLNVSASVAIMIFEAVRQRLSK
ncbi:MAG: TrmH family RNA methyltransferase [Bacteroidales bacterium]